MGHDDRLPGEHAAHHRFGGAGPEGHVEAQPVLGYRRDQLAEGHTWLDHRSHPLERVDEVDLLHAAQVYDDRVADGGHRVSMEMRPPRADRHQPGARFFGQRHQLLDGLKAVHLCHKPGCHLAYETLVGGVGLEHGRVGGDVARSHDFCQSFLCNHVYCLPALG